MPGVVAKHGSAMRLEGEGLPSYHGQRNGDLIVHFNVKFPDNPQETLRALGVPDKGTAAEAEDCTKCRQDLAELQSKVDQNGNAPCTTAGKIPLGDWAASKVLRSRDIEYV